MLAVKQARAQRIARKRMERPQTETRIARERYSRSTQRDAIDAAWAQAEHVSKRDARVTQRASLVIEQGHFFAVTSGEVR